MAGDHLGVVLGPDRDRRPRACSRSASSPATGSSIQSENRPEWLVLDLATVAVRATTVGLYPTNPAAEVSYLLSHSGRRSTSPRTRSSSTRSLEVSDDVPDLERIVYVEPRGIRGRYDDPRLMDWDDFLALGREHRAANPGAVEALVDAAQPDDVMTLVYTSGTTGPPKGAMLSVGQRRVRGDHRGRAAARSSSRRRARTT